METGFEFYDKQAGYKEETTFYCRLRNLETFALIDQHEIKSGGYVVDSLEASIWCLLNTESYQDCVLKAVNLGDDTDTVAAIAGGLAGLYYGFDAISSEWKKLIARYEWIESLCEGMDK